MVENGRVIDPIRSHLLDVLSDKRILYGSYIEAVCLAYGVKKKHLPDKVGELSGWLDGLYAPARNHVAVKSRVLRVNGVSTRLRVYYRRTRVEEVREEIGKNLDAVRELIKEGILV